MSDKTPPIPLQSDTIDEIAGALAQAQAEIEGASKDALNPHYKSKYADLSSVRAACFPSLNKYGIAAIQQPLVWEGDVYIVTTLAHKSGQWLRGVYPLNPVRNDPQGLGSAVTYARRYTLAAMAGVAPEDDDAETAQGRGEKNSNGQSWKREPDALKVDRDTGEVFEGHAKNDRPLLAGFITEAQRRQLAKKAEKHGWSTDQVKAWLVSMDTPSSKDIKASDFDDVMAALEVGPPKADPKEQPF